MKIFIQAIALFFVLGIYPSIFAQTSDRAPEKSLVLEQGVATHKGLDEVYRRFTEAYKKLDVSMVADLYTETAAYLAPESSILIGRQKVSENFSDFFDSVKRGKGRIEISFRIVQRQVDKNLAYDVGIYTLTSFNEKGESSKNI